MNWWEKNPCVYSFTYNSCEYEIQSCEGKYAVFKKTGLYTWERDSDYYDAPKTCFVEYMRECAECDIA